MNKIPTSYAAYYIATGLNGDKDKRGSSISILDLAFRNYEAIWPNPASDKVAQSATLELYKACTVWLKKKSEKKSTKGGKWLTSAQINLNLLHRRQEIGRVAKECLEELQNEGLTTSTRAKYDARKIGVLKEWGSLNSKASLGKGYTLERATWVSSGKQSAISGSLVHEEAKEKFEKLNESKFNWFAQQSGQPMQVVYHNKSDRLNLMVDIDGAGKLVNAETQHLLDCPRLAAALQAHDKFLDRNNYFAECHMYAMDRYGNLFEREQLYTMRAVAKAFGRQFFSYNHSSFNAGHDVVCAGLLGIRQGILEWIDNASGHYKPGVDQLRNAVKILASDGADLSGTYVGEKRADNTMAVYSAADFIDIRGPLWVWDS